MQLAHSQPAPHSSGPSFDPAALRKLTEQLSFPRAFGTAENRRAEEIVANELAAALGSCFRAGETRNVCSGRLETARVLVGAHYDSMPGTPGADDNASAVAVMLAVARLLGPRDDVFYVAFNAEECHLVGSNEFVEQFAGRLLRLEEVHVLEMVGCRDRRPNSQRNPVPLLQVPTVGDFLGVVANRTTLIERLIQQASRITVPVVGLAVPPEIPLALIEQTSRHLLRSDHAPFWEKNIPAAMWTDTAEFRNPRYHQATDTPDTLDYEFMAEVAGLLAAVVSS